MVQLRRLTRRVSLQHAPTFTRDEIGRPIPNWVVYAMPYAERTRGYVSGLDATGQAARTYSTVYRMRADPMVATGQRLIDGADTFRIVGVSDIVDPRIPGDWIQVEIA